MSDKQNIVKETAKALGMTQKELAERIGVKPSAISNWANGDIPKIAELALKQMIEIKELQEKVEKLSEFKRLLDSL